MEHLKRLFSTAPGKGTKDYLNTQKKYEIARTLLYFSISAALFIAGYVQTKERVNLLSVVAVLGCLPACKSLISAIMFCRYKSLAPEIVTQIRSGAEGLNGLFDMVFTSYKVNYQVNHLVVCGNTICGYSNQKTFDETAFKEHLDALLKLDGHNHVTIKVFTDLEKYLLRLEQLKSLSAEDDNKTTEALIQTLLSVSL